MHTNPKLIVAASRFFLILDYDYDSDNQESDSDGNVCTKIALLKQRKGSKMTKRKEEKLDRAIK